jgi:alpha-tubulin suppressor-like RCC1 family protein
MAASRRRRAAQWGENASFWLGAATDSLVPVQVMGLPGEVEALAAGDYHACALVNGDVWCWGSNAFGGLGDGSTADSPVPVQVVGLPGAAQAIAANYDGTCAIVNGGVWCWGGNDYGQLGNGSTTSSPVSAPVQVTGLTSGAQAIASGQWHSCAAANGDVLCWGDNEHGELGDGSTADSSVPVQVMGLPSGL